MLLLSPVRAVRHLGRSATLLRSFSFVPLIMCRLNLSGSKDRSIHRRYFCSVQSPTVQQFFVCFGSFPVFYVSLPVFVIGSFYNTFCIAILMVFCLFISSSIALGPRVVALRPLEELIPGILAASKATSTVKGYNSMFSKVEGS